MIPLRLLNKPLAIAGTSTKRKLLALVVRPFTLLNKLQSFTWCHLAVEFPGVTQKRVRRTVCLQAALSSETVGKFSFELPPSLHLATCLFGTDVVALKNMLCHVTQTQASYGNDGNEIIILYEGAQIREEMHIFSKWLSNKTTLTG